MLERIRDALRRYLADNTGASVLQSDGSYVHLQPAPGELIRDAQLELLDKLEGELVARDD